MYKLHLFQYFPPVDTQSSSIWKGSRNCIFACLCCTLRLKRAQTKGNTSIWMWRESSFTSTDTPEVNTLTETANQIWFSPIPCSSHSPISTGLWQIVSEYYLWPGFLMNLGYFTTHTQQICYTSSQGEGNPYFLVSRRLGLISSGKAGRALDSLPIGCLHHTVSSILLSIKL